MADSPQASTATPTKPEETPEQRAARLSAAAKKAWETRRRDNPEKFPPQGAAQARREAAAKAAKEQAEKEKEAEAKKSSGRQSGKK